jgi:hypothetical protein
VEPVLAGGGLAGFAMGVEGEYDMPPTSLLMWLLSDISAA